MSAEESDVFVILSFQLFGDSDDSADQCIYWLRLTRYVESKNNFLLTTLFQSLSIKVFTADSLIKTASCRHLMV